MSCFAQETCAVTQLYARARKKATDIKKESQDVIDMHHLLMIALEDRK